MIMARKFLTDISVNSDWRVVIFQRIVFLKFNIIKENELSGIDLFVWVQKKTLIYHLPYEVCLVLPPFLLVLRNCFPREKQIPRKPSALIYHIRGLIAKVIGIDNLNDRTDNI